MNRNLMIAVAMMLGLSGLGLGAGLVMRPAPVTAEAIEASVTRTPALLERAWRLPVAATFGGRLEPQTNGSACGPSSLANVFRSLGEPAVDEASVLEGTGKCLAGMCIMGLTLDELAEVASARTARKVTVLRDLTPEAFHEHLKQSNDPAHRYVVNFTRTAIFGSGTGHHSPIGGYLEAEDLVFVLDVNRAYGPWLIKRDKLFAALDTFDGKQKRGLLRIE